MNKCILSSDYVRYGFNCVSAYLLTDDVIQTDIYENITI